MVLVTAFCDSLVLKRLFGIHFFTMKHYKPLVNGRAIAQAISRWLPTAAVRGSKPDLGM
jgi:hypothetical protein